MQNADPNELEKFSQLAHRWWDTGGEFKPLHDINPLRLDWVEQLAAGLDGKTILDIGCGGGILAESMAGRGAAVTGIDLSDKALGVARLHLLESGKTVSYRKASAEELASEYPARFDIVTCMEMLEHVPDPASIVSACAQLLKPGGHVFFATLNRNPKSWLMAVVGAEYVLGILPRGTHEYARFIKPSELVRWAGAAGFQARKLCGLSYNPWTRQCRLRPDTGVNYLLHAVKPEHGAP